MKYANKIYLIALLTVCVFAQTIQLVQAQTYNNLWIPDTLSGTTFNLTIRDTFVQFRAGNQTITGGVNGSFWGPTLIMNKGDMVHLNVHNKLNDSTTIHWHGMHLPPIMDGGPHQIIPPGTIWQPYWTVKNQAATLWYHPHLHEMTQEHVTKGIGGFIIIRDAEEAALPLPRTYGVDDIPLALTSRRFLSSNQMAHSLIDNYGDYELVNGTLNPQVSLPKQVVRLRLLNGEIQRGYNLGFSDNRTFYVIGTDDGLLNAPVAVTRVALQTGERLEILVDLSGDAVGGTLDLKAYNSASELQALTPGQNVFGWPGNEGNPVNPSGNNGPINSSLLNNTNFNILRINIKAATANAITAIPTALVNNTYWTTADVTNSRTINVTGGQMGTAFSLNNQFFSLNTVNQTVNLDAVEKWTIVNNNVFGHAFHLHDVPFKIIARSGGNLGTNLRSYEQGWKDVAWIPIGGSVTFIAKFDDYSDPTWPYMYHCHALTHEDEGMMGSFVVKGTTGTVETDSNGAGFSVYPNPVHDRLFVSLDDPTMRIYYARVLNAGGKTVMMLPRPQLDNGLDINSLSAGVYFLQLTDEKTKNVSTRKFIKQL
ncbi:MAG: multicopper oxidase domain-containing protein [Bacteroidota bacterium]